MKSRYADKISRLFYFYNIGFFLGGGKGEYWKQKSSHIKLPLASLVLPTYPNLFFLALKMDMQAFDIQLQNHNKKQVISNQGNNKDHFWFYRYQWLFGVLRLL